jgi:hypothetical protein
MKTTNRPKISASSGIALSRRHAKRLRHQTDITMLEISQKINLPRVIKAS